MATSMGLGASVDKVRAASVVGVLVLLGAVAPFVPAAAQQDDRVANCTEKLIAQRVNIGHDCGEFASVLIAGNVVIQRPWSRVNRASRAERIRARREAGGAAPPAAPEVSVPAASDSSAPTCHPT